MCPMLGRTGSAYVYNRSHPGIEKDNRGTMGNRRKEKAEPGRANSVGTEASSASNGKFSLISDEKLLALYKDLLKCRIADGRNGNSNGTAKAARAQEAALVASAIDLGPGDVVCSREHGLLPGVPGGATIEKLIGRRAHQHPASSQRSTLPTNGASPEGAGPLITQTALGTALEIKTKKNGKIAVIFSSEKSPDTLREAVEIASLHALPMVFVHQADGNGNARRAKPRAGKASGKERPWFPQITVDTHDVVAVYRVASEAISRARQGRGPTLIECQSFHVQGRPAISQSSRHGRHVHDAIINMEHYLRMKGLFDPKLKTRAFPQS